MFIKHQTNSLAMAFDHVGLKPFIWRPPQKQSVGYLYKVL